MLEKTSSRMVRILGSVKSCWSCGYSPVRLEATWDCIKQFCYTCPNETCEEYWKSPPERFWKRSKAEAEAVWNEANKRFAEPDSDTTIAATIDKK